MTELFGGGTEDRKEAALVLRISRGKEEGFHYLQEWFAENVASEQVIHARKTDGDAMGMPSETCTDTTLSPCVGSLRMKTV